MGTPTSGNICLGVSYVSGRSRVPLPPARMMACNYQPFDVVVVVLFVVVVVVGAIPAVVVVVGVIAEANIASTVVADGGVGVTPVGSKAIVTRRSLTNLIVAGLVVSVGVF